MGDGFIPGRHTFLMIQRRQLPVFVRQQHLAAGVEGRANILLAGEGDIVGVAAHRECFRHFIQVTRSLFAIAGHTRLIAYASGQITDDQADGEHHAEGEQVLDVGDGERAAWSNKEEIKTDHVDHRCQHRRPAAIEQRDDHHPQQIEHDQVGGVKRH